MQNAHHSAAGDEESNSLGDRYEKRAGLPQVEHLSSSWDHQKELVMITELGASVKSWFHDSSGNLIVQYLLTQQKDCIFHYY